MNRTAVAVASFRKTMSRGIPDAGGSDPSSSDGANTVVKKKLCRVSKGYANGQNLLKFSAGDEDESTEDGHDSRNSRSAKTTPSEGVAREICGDHFVEICVVRRNQNPAVADDRPADANADAQEVSVASTDHEDVCVGENTSWTTDPKFSDERNRSKCEQQQQRRKRVAFSDAITVHNFENQDDSCDLNSENMFGMDDDDPPTPEQNDIKLSTPTDIYHKNAVNSSSSQADSETVIPKKVPLRRLVFGQVTRAYNKASLFRSLLRDSVRRSTSSLRGRTTVARTKSLVDRSVRHSFIKLDDPSGTHVQLVVPLGPHYAPNGVSVTTSGDGKKIKVLAMGKRGSGEDGLGSDDGKHDYHECFYLPKAINPLLTKATVDSEGHLKIEAPFATSYAPDIYFDKVIR